MLSKILLLLNKKINKIESYKKWNINIDNFDFEKTFFIKFPFNKLVLIENFNTIWNIIRFFIIFWLWFLLILLRFKYTSDIIIFTYFLYNITLLLNLFFIINNNNKEIIKKKLKYPLIVFLGFIFIPWIISFFKYLIILITNWIKQLFEYLLKLVIMISPILIFLAFFFAEWKKTKNNNWRIKKSRWNIKSNKPKISRAIKTRMKAYNSVKKAGIKWTKPFYKRKWLLICSNCWSTGKLTCDNCGYESNKRKQAWNCPKCWKNINRIYCRKCGLTQYLK